MTYLLLGLLAFPVLMLLAGCLGHRLFKDADVRHELVSTGPKSETLFVLIHGMTPSDARWRQLVEAFQPEGHVLRLSYNAAAWSNADPMAIAGHMATEIDAATQATGAQHVVIVAHSMGALLTRRAILDARHSDWVMKRLKRVVLLAGVNRGWDIAGPAPADADPLRIVGMHVGTWGARMLNLSSLIFSFERGAPFVANLRLDWMRWMRDELSPKIEVVQMIGDIDDIVTHADNEDLRVMQAGAFTQMTVRGTGHGEIVEFGAGEPRGSDESKLGEYRRSKVLDAATGSFQALLAQSEVQPYANNDKVTQLVFVLHGIRDLGRWSADFESAIAKRPGVDREQWAIVSPRYGYFGMGPFLFEGVRDRYVRWFMDQYTETLARYPHVKPQGIRFFGHSNGTYIAMEALKTYHSMEIDRVVLAGSVVAKDYDWSCLTKADPATGQQRRRVQQVRNYVGSEDWVVALFPRLFELPGMTLLGNHIGSAGFNGFDGDGGGLVENVRFIKGEHGAFSSRIDEIVQYLLKDETPGTKVALDKRSWVGDVLSAWPVVLAVWLALIYAVVSLGTRVVAASSQPIWPALLAYILVVVMVLRTV